MGGIAPPSYTRPMNDYERMARVLRFLDCEYVRQPSLNELAAASGLSPSHFHRLFSKWVGVTPKDFVQCLTAEHAKELLRHGTSVLDCALETGLSGPGRLHDLLVSLEAATPGDLKRGGEGLVIDYGFAMSPFGECLAAQSQRGICRLSFVDSRERDGVVAALAADWPAATLVRNDRAAQALLSRVFVSTPERTRARPLRAFVQGTPFQIQVWRGLLQIPPGAAVTYGQIAAALGTPTSARAVGRAVGANPLACLIPCHRVIRQTGALGGYHWGLGRKRALLARESALDPRSLLDESIRRP